MEIFYKKPFLQEDGTVVLDQVTVIREGELPQGIKRRELKVIQELYPSLELLKKTITMAAQNYNDTDMQSDKSVGQLEAEKTALLDLKKMVDEMD